jgi:hypothetical protein
VEVRLADARNREQIRSTLGSFDAVVDVIGGVALRRNDVASSASAIVVSAHWPVFWRFSLLGTDGASEAWGVADHNV